MNKKKKYLAIVIIYIVFSLVCVKLIISHGSYITFGSIAGTESAISGFENGIFIGIFIAIISFVFGLLINFSD